MDLLEFCLMRSNGLAGGVEDHKSCARRTLIDAANVVFLIYCHVERKKSCIIDIFLLLRSSSTGGTIIERGLIAVQESTVQRVNDAKYGPYVRRR